MLPGASRTRAGAESNGRNLFQRNSATVPFLWFLVFRDKDEGRLKNIAEFHFISGRDY